MPRSDAATPTTATCLDCGSSVLVLSRFQDYSTTRGPMAEYVITRCEACGQQHMSSDAAQARGRQAQDRRLARIPG